MSCEDVGAEEWREQRSWLQRNISTALGKGFFHPSNKQRLKLISCFGYETFPFWTSEYSATGQINGRAEGRIHMWLCNETFWDRLKSRNEAQRDDKWGQRPIFLTLHDSHANLFDVLITWLFTLERKRWLNRFHNSVWNIYGKALLLSEGGADDVLCIQRTTA